MFVLLFGQGLGGSPGQNGDPGSSGEKVSYKEFMQMFGREIKQSWHILSVV